MFFLMMMWGVSPIFGRRAAATCRQTIAPGRRILKSGGKDSPPAERLSPVCGSHSAVADASPEMAARIRPRPKGCRQFAAAIRPWPTHPLKWRQGLGCGLKRVVYLRKSFRCVGMAAANVRQGFRPAGLFAAKVRQGFRHLGMAVADVRQGFRHVGTVAAGCRQGFRPAGRLFSLPAHRKWRVGDANPSTI